MIGGFWTKFTGVQWLRTIWVNLLRAFAAGIVWGIVLSGVQTAEPMPFSWYTFPLYLPFVYLIFVPLFYLSGAIATFFMGPLAMFGFRFFSFIYGLMMMVGDPLVYALHSVLPAAVPVPRFRLLNPTLVLYVYPTTHGPAPAT